MWTLTGHVGSREVEGTDFTKGQWPDCEYETLDPQPAATCPGNQSLYQQPTKQEAGPIVRFAGSQIAVSGDNSGSQTITWVITGPK